MIEGIASKRELGNQTKPSITRATLLENEIVTFRCTSSLEL